VNEKLFRAIVLGVVFCLGVMLIWTNTPWKGAD
jgi:hypothetical protein